MSLIRRLIRTDGTEEDFPGPLTMDTIERLIGASTLDTVPLRHMGQPLHVMLVDDLGVAKGRPVNAEATRLYWANCKPGTTFQIRGDVVVVPDLDYDT